MGKAKRIKKEKAKKEQKKPDMIMREKSADNFVKNIKAMTELGWDKNGFLDRLKKAPEREVAIDKQIVFQGVRNPLVTIFIGFSR